jgi:hypothetical protein
MLLIILFLQTSISPVLAQTNGAAKSSFVQQGLTIYEIDKELVRLKDQEADLRDEIIINKQQLEAQSTVLEQRREAAGRVLRAYYVGQRDNIWLLLFEMQSFSDLLVTIDYLSVIVRNDMRTLDAFTTALEDRKRLITSLEAKQQQVTDTIAQYTYQRNRIISLQTELDRQLATLADAERAIQLQQIKEATSFWETEGAPLFEQMLSALSVAMVDLPELFSDNNRLQLRGRNVIVRLTDDDFNTFLRERNDLFQKYTFTFNPEGIVVTGSVKNHKATVQGNYTVESQPVNALRFQLSSIIFNDFALPDTTQRALEKKYDLAFYPNQLLPSLVVQSLNNLAGEMEVLMSFQRLPFGGAVSTPN